MHYLPPCTNQIESYAHARYVHVQACTILFVQVHVKVGLLLSAVSLANISNDYVQFLSLNAVNVAS